MEFLWKILGLLTCVFKISAKNEVVPATSKGQDSMIEDYRQSSCVKERTWSGNKKELLPSWINITLAVQGQQFFLQHLLLVTQSFTAGNFMLLANPQIKATLAFTGNSNNPSKAGYRYAATLSQILLWFRVPFDSEDHNSVLTSLAKVREIHNHVALKVQHAIDNEIYYKKIEENSQPFKINEEMWAAFESDLRESRIPVKNGIPTFICQDETDPMSQFMFAITQWAFLAPALTLLEYVQDQQGKLAYAHLWAVYGYALGIEDKYNLGLYNNYTELLAVNQDFYKVYVLPHLFSLDHVGKVSMESFVLGMGKILYGHEPEFIQRLVLRDILKIEAKTMNGRRSWWGWICDWAITEGNRLSQEYSAVHLFYQLLNWLVRPMHCLIGYSYFPFHYSSDESIAKFCYFYDTNNPNESYTWTEKCVLWYFRMLIHFFTFL